MGNIRVHAVLHRMLLKTINCMAKIVYKQFFVDNRNL